MRSSRTYARGSSRCLFAPARVVYRMEQISSQRKASGQRHLMRWPSRVNSPFTSVPTRNSRKLIRFLKRPINRPSSETPFGPGEWAMYDAVDGVSKRRRRGSVAAVDIAHARVRALGFFGRDVPIPVRHGYAGVGWNRRATLSRARQRWSPACTDRMRDFCVVAAAVWRTASSRGRQASTRIFFLLRRPGLRLKGPGMHWTEAGALAVTALRATDHNGQWKAFWRKFVLTT